MFNFKKKEQLTEQEKNIIKQVSLFYEMHNNIFIEFCQDLRNKKSLLIEKRRLFYCFKLKFDFNHGRYTEKVTYKTQHTQYNYCCQYER